MELKTIGKSRPYELTGESAEKMLVRFLIHFLFVEHNSKTIDLFDGEDSIFKLLENQHNAKNFSMKPLTQLQVNTLQSPNKKQDLRFDTQANQEGSNLDLLTNVRMRTEADDNSERPL